MRISELLKGLNVAVVQDIEIKNISYNSKDIKEGSLFVAIKGQRADGHDFIEDAIKKGAISVILERDEKKLKDRYKDCLFIFVEDSRTALATISSNFYGRISERVPVIGVTGTNGKTTTTFLIKSILETAGIKTGLIGTIHYEIGDRILPASHTTPESLDFQRLLKEIYDSGCRAVVAEVSSHGLALKRVDGTVFKRAVFTNLSRDHLDFHGDMENYFMAKARLFTELLENGAPAIINNDDEYGLRLKALVKDKMTYGIISGDIRALNINNSIKGLSFDVSFNNRTISIESRLTGLINVYNILGAFGVTFSLGIPIEAIREGIKRLESVKGRFQRIDMGQDFLVVVDYAHTPDSLKRLILTAREILTDSATQQSSPVPGRIITLFGCGGDRDRGKRPLMGEIATKLSDFVIITTDNPRSEDPNEIIADILRGVIGENYAVIPDREEAIRHAIKSAASGDIILIAGKGHEDYQEIKGQRFYFSDEETVRKVLKERQVLYAST
ncbi:MAG: UDP-N-acetylmuramoyl-L-alanyl-D-glutamate--2,6-diaminopimelate ligase [Thermodesulfovibrionales bacterium]|nr:UDP-N-acetylmuramoyl-L-alanyl-D-glutamate--2,6-diaminopimelate ligase [Thermodesulfovibrionales bacterium]